MIGQVEMKKSNSESSKLDRKTVERNRRIHMKGLCFKLASLVPPHHYKTSKDTLSQQDQLDFAATYIKQLKDRIDGLKRRKDQLAVRANSPIGGVGAGPTASVGVKLPVIQLREWDSGLEVSLISGVNKNFRLYEAISILHEEGAEVVSASFSTIGDKIFHTLHAQVRISRVGIETSRVWQRLHELTYQLHKSENPGTLARCCSPHDQKSSFCDEQWNQSSEANRLASWREH